MMCDNVAEFPFSILLNPRENNFPQTFSVTSLTADPLQASGATEFHKIHESIWAVSVKARKKMFTIFSGDS